MWTTGVQGFDTLPYTIFFYGFPVVFVSSSERSTSAKAQLAAHHLAIGGYKSEVQFWVVQ